MKLSSAILLAGVAQAFAGPPPSYDRGKPMVSSKQLQKGVTTKG